MSDFIDTILGGRAPERRTVTVTLPSLGSLVGFDENGGLVKVDRYWSDPLTDRPNKDGSLTLIADEATLKRYDDGEPVVDDFSRELLEWIGGPG